MEMRSVQGVTGVRPLRPRPFTFLGYSRTEVELLLSALELRLRQLEQEADRARELDVQLRAAQAEIAAYRAREFQVTDAIAGAQRRAQEIEESAAQQARTILARAEEDASRIRGQAHLQADAAGTQIDEVLRLKEATIESFRRILQEMSAALGRVERGEPAPPPSEPGVDATGAPTVPTHAPVAAAQATAAPDEPRFEQRIEIEAGPFPDFSALSAFERALGRLPSVVDVYVRRFFDDQATIEVTLSEETPLLANMRAMLPFRFDVEHADGRRVALTVHTQALAGA